MFRLYSEISFKVYNVMVHVHCERIALVKLINTFITSQSNLGVW